MNRFTLLFIALISFGFATQAQRVAEQNAFLVHSFNGTLTSAQAYADGVMWVGNDGTNDVVGYTLDGSAFTNLENLEAGSASNLCAWAGSSMGFYYGNKVSDGVGIDLRVNDNGSGRLLWDMSGGHDPANPALSNVIRVDQGADGYRYYYIAQGANVAPTGNEVILWESDGTDFGTFEVEKGLTNDNPFDPNERISVKVTNGHNSGQLVSTVHNDKLHIVAAIPGPLGNPSAIFYVDYDSNGSTLELLSDIEGEVYSWTHLIGNGDYLFAISDDGAMVGIDNEGEKMAVNNGSLLSFAGEQPVKKNNTIYAISNTNSLKKLAIIKSPTDVEIININAEGEDDNISNLTISGNKLFFWASKTGSNDYYSYALRLDLEGAVPVEIGFVYEGQEITSIIPLHDGSIAYAYLSSFGASAKVTEGFTSTSYMAVDDDNTDGNYTYSWDGEIVKIIAQGNTLYYFVEATDEVSGNPLVKIYTLEHVPAEETKPSPLPITTFYRGNFIFNVTDSETGDPIEGATVTIRQRELLLDEMSAISNASGQALYPWKPISYYHFMVSATGYQSLEYDQWATIWVPDELYNAYGERDVQLTPDGATAIEGVEEGNISVYPNPVKDFFNIRSESEIVALEIYSISGNRVMQKRAAGIQNVDVSALPAGLYMAIITNVEGQSKTIKITKH